jgi:diacylglycerol kinase (ATP)
VELASAVFIPKRQKIPVIFINTRSGGRLGVKLFDVFRDILGPPSAVSASMDPLDVQICDMSKRHPYEYLQSVAGCAADSVFLVVCGGDGTVGWVMNAASRLKLSFPVAILPLGTGNDLARTFHWGPGTQPGDVTVSNLSRLLVAASKAQPQYLDRWAIDIYRADGMTQVRCVEMNNYLSFGVDAEVALKFHTEREKNPDEFNSQSGNLLKYARYGLEGALESRPLWDTISIAAVDKGNTPNETTQEIPIELNPHWKGVVVSNIPCYQGGRDFWGKSTGEDDYDEAAVDDGLLEVMALSGMLHIGLVQLSLDQALRLAKVRGLKVYVNAPICVQVDGEPWIQEKGILRVRHLGKYPILRGPCT